MNFDQNRLFEYVKAFSFPRLCGTDGEKEAVDLTINTFKEIGFKENEIQKQEFEFSDFYSTTLIQLIAMISLTTIITLVLFLYIYPIISIPLILIIFLIVYLILRGLRHPETAGFWGKYYGNIIDATNVFVKIPAKSISEVEAGNIVISAHLDSKSQSFKTIWRILIYKIGLFAGVPLGIAYVIFLIYRLIKWYVKFIYISPEIEEVIAIINIIILILTVIISIPIVILIFLSTHNKSPGALDNATGMSVVFELSSYFRDMPLNNFNMFFCQFSAEELGTMGSRTFVNKYETEFMKGRIFQINLEMISAATRKKNRVEFLESYGIYPRKKNYAPILSNYLKEAAKQENLKIYGYHLSTGAHTDSVPFRLRDFDAVDILTTAGARYTHNKEDTPDKVDPQVLLETCVIVRKVIQMLDNDFKI